MEGLSDTALWIAIIACGVATLGYWAQMVGVRLVFRRLSTEAGEGPTVAAIVSDEDRPGWTEHAGNLGRFAGTLGTRTSLIPRQIIATTWAAIWAELAASVPLE